MAAFQSQTNDRVYSYQISWPILILGICFFTFAAVTLAGMAGSNHRGLFINGLIKLSPAQASIFFAVLSFASAGMVAIAALSLVCRVTAPQKLILATEGLFAPRWIWSREPTLIKYENIHSTVIQTERGYKFLKIAHTRGHQTITAARLPSPADFHEFCELLNLRIQDSRPDPLLASADSDKAAIRGQEDFAINLPD